VYPCLSSGIILLGNQVMSRLTWRREPRPSFWNRDFVHQLEWSALFVL
jgi:hypothetical protein